MCNSTTPIEQNPKPKIETFETTEEFLAAVTPGMDLCTSDFTGWADIDSIENPEAGDEATIIATVRESGASVRVPANVLLDLRGGHCVRIDRVRATVNDQGWEA